MHPRIASGQATPSAFYNTLRRTEARSGELDGVKLRTRPGELDGVKLRTRPGELDARSAR